MSLSQAVILAGGLGTRLQPFTLDNPKPMIEIEGVPFLEHLIIQVKSWGIDNIVMLLGYLPEKIEDYFGDGRRFGVNIEYSVTPIEYDTGLRIKNAYELFDDEFILLYCDNYCPIDFRKAYEQFSKSDNMIQLTVYSNKDGYTKSNLLVEDGQVVLYDKKRVASGLQGVDIGYIFLKKQVLSVLSDRNVNFESEVYPKILEKGRLGAYVTEHRYYSIGSWERIELTKEFFKPKKVAFLDRDGTLNVRPPRACYIERKEDFVWLPKAKEAVALLKQKGYKIYLITNQPGIARGNITWDDLNEINNKMLHDLDEINVRLDGIYICPHGWDEGCDCRKPKPGMLYNAQKDHSLNLTQCVLIGDDERDIEAGNAAGLAACYMINERMSLWDIVDNYL
ncbi:MAG: HAD-IIIA family hydrolase [Lachnospiraceae bacterium]|nr:HAD-IIIA family hydrolase [Lachnospiraceae bacterium]